MKNCKCTFAQKMQGDGCDICNPSFTIEMLKEQIKELEAEIESQQIIIRDKTAFMEAMAQPKTCDGCACYDPDIYFPECDGCKRHEETIDRYTIERQS